MMGGRPVHSDGVQGTEGEVGDGSGGCSQRHGGINTRVGKSARRRLAMEKASWTDVSFFWQLCLFLTIRQNLENM